MKARLLLAGMVVAALGLPSAQAAQRAYPGTNGKIVFVSNRGGSGLALYTMNANGGGVKRITPEEARVGQPSWSADGSRIAYVQDSRILIVEADGSPVTTLTPDGVRFPSWKPSGDKLAFEVNDSVAVINADDSGWKYIRQKGSGGDEFPAWEPSWSPLGTSIAYVQGTGYFSGSIAVMKADGTGSHALTKGHDLGEIDSVPDWSPDGKKIAFQRYVDCSGGTCANAVYAMNADGSGLHLVKKNAATPSWSPDGKRLLFVRRVSGNSEIFVMKADGTGVKRLTKNGHSDFSPDWQP
ncbi:MAG: TolB family protein [Gaiellaceae bacterium]